MATDGAPAAGQEEKLELARHIARLLAERDPSDAERLFHPELEFHDAWALGAGVYRGPAGIRQLLEDLSTAWEEFSFEAVELEPTPDGRVLMTARQVTRKARSREVERKMYFLLTFRDGKLVSWDGWHLQAVARVAAGVS